MRSRYKPSGNDKKIFYYTLVKKSDRQANDESKNIEDNKLSDFFKTWKNKSGILQFDFLFYCAIMYLVLINMIITNLLNL